jgi:DNA-damage-inducible protein J
MAKTSLLQVRIDSELKKDAEKLFQNIGLDTSSAVRLFFKQSVISKSIPFPIASQINTNDSAPEQEIKVWKGLTPGMKSPVHLKNYRKYTRDELHDRKNFS